MRYNLLHLLIGIASPVLLFLFLRLVLPRTGPKTYCRAIHPLEFWTGYKWLSKK
jgi:hypothetical protein